ncbi:hypothetical protein ACV6WX_001465 [Shigella flexneri]
MINTTPEHKVAGILDKIKIIFAEAKKNTDSLFDAYHSPYKNNGMAHIAIASG